MLRFVQTDLFESNAQTLVNTVNTVGVMGKGIARQFRDRYPLMFSEYKQFCNSKELTIGALHVWRGVDRWVLNFPTKTTWRLPSNIDYIEQGLYTFCSNYWRLGIRSVAFPPLGCGNGELNWHDIKPLMVKYLNTIDIPVWIHEVFYRRGFKPEQHEPVATLPPETFAEFVRDFAAVVIQQSGRFRQWGTNRPFIAEVSEGGSLIIYVDRKVVVDEDFLAMAWVGLRLGVLTTDYFGYGHQSPGLYILPIAAELPYVRLLKFKRAEDGGQSSGLIFAHGIENFVRRPIAA